VVGVAAGAIYSAATGADMGESILSGFLIGFGVGAIVGAVIGGAKAGFQIANAAKQWGATTPRSSFKNMTLHFNKHVIKEGHTFLGKNVIEYTKNAKQFFEMNSHMMKLTKSGNYVIRAMFNGYKAGGFFSITGLIFSFFS